MDATILNNLIRTYDIFDVERALVLRFSQQNHISLQASRFLSEYVGGFSPSAGLESAVAALRDFSLEDLAVGLELLIPEEDRILNGAFFTPAYIVDYIIDNIAPGETETVADISCGCGSFLLGVIRYYRKKYGRTISAVLSENLYGADILEYNMRRAKILICLYALSCGETVDESQIGLICCDSLKHKWPRKFDCIVGNPPYVKFQDLTDERREYLSANWSTTSFGTFNLYFAFFEIGHRLLSEKGRLGYITPNNYFTSLSGESLRAYFQKHRCIYGIVDFGATKVFDVQTYTAITFMSRAENEAIGYGRIKSGQNPCGFLSSVSFSANAYDVLNTKKWRLLCGEERHNINQIESVGKPIGDLFNICVGIATLKDNVYSFFPTGADDTYFYFERDGRQWRVEKTMTRPTVKISDMKCQDDVENNRRHFIFPYKRINGRMTAVSEDEMRKNFPSCYEYFDYVREILAGRGKGKHVYKPFYSYGRTQGLNRRGVKLYTPTFSKTPRFLIDFDEDSLFTNGYGIFFKDRSGSLFETDPISDVGNLDIIQKILNSEIMNYYIGATSVAIEGGYPCYQKNFIEKFTIPDLDERQIERIRAISDPDELNVYLETIYQVNLPAPNLCS